MELLENICIGCIEYYTYRDYVYFNNITDTIDEHNNHFILNQIQDFILHHCSNYAITYLNHCQKYLLVKL